MLYKIEPRVDMLSILLTIILRCIYSATVWLTGNAISLFGRQCNWFDLRLWLSGGGFDRQVCLYDKRWVCLTGSKLRGLLGRYRVWLTGVWFDWQVPGVVTRSSSVWLAPITIWCLSLLTQERTVKKNLLQSQRATVTFCIRRVGLPM